MKSCQWEFLVSINIKTTNWKKTEGGREGDFFCVCGNFSIYASPCWILLIIGLNTQLGSFVEEQMTPHTNRIGRWLRAAKPLQFFLAFQRVPLSFHLCIPWHGPGKMKSTQRPEPDPNFRIWVWKIRVQVEFGLWPEFLSGSGSGLVNLGSDRVKFGSTRITRYFFI